MEIGLIVTGSSGKRYRIERYLGEGVTSLVYEAVELTAESEHSDKVALKMLRPQVGEIIEANFWQEAQILGELATAARSVGDEVSHVPRVLETRRDGEWRFLAMELVTGVPLDRELEEKRFLPEADALFVAREVLHVLVLLHDKVRRSYTDFQLQNIWLQRDAEGGLTGVKVMDWNHVSDQVKEDQALPEGFGQQDLARFAAYFYRMLTGKGADERGEHERALQKRAGEQWDALSLGTKQIVRQALHPNPTRRYATAHSFYEAVQAQHALWQEDWMDLLGKVRKTLERRNLEEAELEWVEWRLDMAQRLGGTTAHINYYKQQLAPQTSDISLRWDSGEKYYKVGQYRSAAEKWRAEAEGRGRVDLWRRVMLADAGAILGGKRFELVREGLEEVVQALNDYQWAPARKKFDELGSGNKIFLCEPVKILRADVWLHSEVENAQAYEVQDDVSSWQKAAEAYRTALKGLKLVDYANLIVEEQGWHDLQERAERQQQRVNEHQHTQQVGNALEKKLRRNFQDGLNLIEFELERDPSDQGALQLCLTEGTRLFEAGKVQKAAALLQIGVLYGEPSAYQMGELRQTWQQARQILRQEAEKKAIEQVHEQKLAAWRKKLEEKRAPFEKQYNQQQSALKEKYDQKFAKLQTKYQKQIAEAKEGYEQELKTDKEQHGKQLAAQKAKNEQQFAMAQKAHLQALQDLQNKSQKAWEEHEQALSAQKEKYEQALLAQKEEYEQKEEEYTKKKLQKLLDDGHWDEFLELVNQVSDSHFSDKMSWDSYVRSIQTHFRNAVRARLMPLADKLERILDLLDPDEMKRNKRRQSYESMIEKLETDQVKWELYIKRDIVNRVIKTDPAQYDDIIKRVEFFLSFSKKHYPQLTTWLEKTLSLLKKGGPTPTTIEASQSEWKAWLRSTLYMLIEDISKPTAAILEDGEEPVSKVAQQVPQQVLPQVGEQALEEATGEKQRKRDRVLSWFKSKLGKDEEDEERMK